MLAACSHVSLLDLLQFTRNFAQHTRSVVPVLCDDNINYRICKADWTICLFLRLHPRLYDF